MPEHIQQDDRIKQLYKEANKLKPQVEKAQKRFEEQYGEKIKKLKELQHEIADRCEYLMDHK